jgi:hypothetical protein
MKRRNLLDHQRLVDQGKITIGLITFNHSSSYTLFSHAWNEDGFRTIIHFSRTPIERNDYAAADFWEALFILA